MSRDPVPQLQLDQRVHAVARDGSILLYLIGLDDYQQRHLSLT